MKPKILNYGLSLLTAAAALSFDHISAIAATDSAADTLEGNQKKAPSTQEMVSALSRKVADLESRLVVQEDISAIHKLKARYVSFADQKYLNGRPNTPEMIDAAAQGISKLFTEDGEWGGGLAGPMLKGRKAVYERIKGTHSPFIMHYMVSPEIKVQGDTAYARWYVLNFVQDEKGNPAIVSGIEDDTYNKIDGKWYFKLMKWNDVFAAPYQTGWTYPDAFPKPDSGNELWKEMPFK